MTSETLPVAIIGAGPVGLAAAAHLVLRGERPIVLEAGDRSAPRSGMGARPLVLPLALHCRRHRGHLLRGGWAMPEPEHLPTGRSSSRTTSSRWRRFRRSAAPPARRPRRARDPSRRRQAQDGGPRRGAVRAARAEPAGEEREVLARAVIDASGTSASPNPLGAAAVPRAASGAARAHVFYGIPDVLGAPPRPATPAGASPSSGAATRPSTSSRPGRARRRRSPVRGSPGSSAARPVGAESLRRRAATPCRPAASWGERARRLVVDGGCGRAGRASGGALSPDDRAAAAVAWRRRGSTLAAGR